MLKFYREIMEYLIMKEREIYAFSFVLFLIDKVYERNIFVKLRKSCTSCKHYESYETYPNYCKRNKRE